MIARQPLPEAFQRSYLESDTYPKNLVHRTVQTYPGALQKIADRLNEAAGRLFEHEDGIHDVPFRDLQLATGEGENFADLLVCRELIVETQSLIKRTLARRLSWSNG